MQCNKGKDSSLLIARSYHLNFFLFCRSKKSILPNLRKTRRIQGAPVEKKVIENVIINILISEKRKYKRTILYDEEFDWRIWVQKRERLGIEKIIDTGKGRIKIDIPCLLSRSMRYALLHFWLFSVLWRLHGHLGVCAKHHIHSSYWETDLGTAVCLRLLIRLEHWLDIKALSII